jgi:hypothetical protein
MREKAKKPGLAVGLFVLGWGESHQPNGRRAIG